MSYPVPKGWPRFISPQSTISDAELRALKKAGFDHIRLLIDPEIYLEETQPHRKELDDRLLKLIDRIHMADLNVIAVNFTRHTARNWKPEKIFTTKTDLNYQAFSNHVVHIAQLLNRFEKHQIRYVMVSEPQKECFLEPGTGKIDWLVFQRDLYARTRTVAPHLWLGLTGGCYSAISGLDKLTMDGFDNETFVDVHFYSPFTFTHQGATWTMPAQRYVAGLTYPSKKGAQESVKPLIDKMYEANPSDINNLNEAYERAHEYLSDNIDSNTIKSYFVALEAWRKRENISRERIAIGEFGALRPSSVLGQSSQDSRLNWLQDTRRIMEGFGYSWSMWDYFPPFSLLNDTQARTLDIPTLKALGLNAQ
ncbi:MAG: cellulase family glycosylhydrolase [Hyphomicrobiales bacterium]